MMMYNDYLQLSYKINLTLYSYILNNNYAFFLDPALAPRPSPLSREYASEDCVYACVFIMDKIHLS